MREILFRILNDTAGCFKASTDDAQLHITAASLEELRHEARQVLIDRLGPTHHTYRLRFLRAR
jgi:hypothetical protein